MDDRVTINTANHVAEVMLNRADKLNALDVCMFEAINAAIDSVSADKTLRAVVLHGAGDHFCSGIDIAVMSDRSLDFHKALATPLPPSSANLFQKVAYGWRELRVPVICALQGVTFGGGLQIALGADVRIASPDCQLSIMESKWGLIPDMGISTTLRGLITPDRAKELAWSGRIIKAQEACELGLVTSVGEQPLALARAMAADLAARSPQSIQGIKTLVESGWQLADADALALEAELQGRVIGSPNQMEAVAANLKKRAPEFSDD